VEEGDAAGEMRGVECAVVEEPLAGEGFGVCGYGLVVWRVGKGQWEEDIRSGSNCKTWILQSASATAIKSCLPSGSRSAAMTSM